MYSCRSGQTQFLRRLTYLLVVPLEDFKFTEWGLSLETWGLVFLRAVFSNYLIKLFGELAKDVSQVFVVFVFLGKSLIE